MVCTVDVIAGSEGMSPGKKELATFLSKKWKRGYSEMVFYVQVRMTIVVVRANSLLICAAGIVRNLVFQITLTGPQCTIGRPGRRGERPLVPTRVLTCEYSPPELPPAEMQTTASATRQLDQPGNKRQTAGEEDDV